MITEPEAFPLPKAIRIGNRDYAVRFFEADEEKLATDDLSGHVIFAAGLIRIAKGQDKTWLLETLLHEIGHAINKLADLSDSSTEEDHVLRATPLWMAVFRDNQALLHLLNRYAIGTL